MGDIFEPDFQLENFGVIPANYFRDLPAEYSMATISSLKLADSYERGELSGDLQQIASKVKECDNSVLTLIKFKKWNFNDDIIGIKGKQIHRNITNINALVLK